MVKRNLAAGGLHFTTDAERAAHFGTIQFIAVGTPPPKATPNCSTYGHPNCSRQDGQIMGFGVGAWAGFLG